VLLFVTNPSPRTQFILGVPEESRLQGLLGYLEDVHVGYWTVITRDELGVLDIYSFLLMIDYIAVLFLQISFSYGTIFCFDLESGLCNCLQKAYF
jgi:hypothetical protein